ncbi:MAG: hypothetical protein Q9159_006084 [Coniocarpon cinnabarinum]
MSSTTTMTKPDNAQSVQIAAAGQVSGAPEHFGNWPNESGELSSTLEGILRTAISLRTIGTSVDPSSYLLYLCVTRFDGFTHVHKFNIEPQASGVPHITYSSRMQADGVLEHARTTGSLAGITFAQKRDPCDSFFKKLKSVWEPSKRSKPNEVNVGVSFQQPVHRSAKDGLGNEGHATLTETSDQARTLEFDLETLEAFGVTDQSKLHPSLNGELSAAHPCVDPHSGDVFNYNLKLGPTPTYRIFRVNTTDGTTDVLATITGVEPTYIHSQFLTPNFYILCVWNATIGGRGVKVLWERNILSAINDFDPNAQTEWIVVDRNHKQGVVARFTSSAFFCFHTVNAFEVERSNGKVDIQCELVTHPNLDVLHHFYYDHLVSNGPKAGGLSTATQMALKRYLLAEVEIPNSKASKDSTARRGDVSKLIPRKAEVVSTIAADGAGELPTINLSYAQRPNRYVYAVGDRGLSTFVDSIVKADTSTGQSLRWSEQAHTPGEPVFIADPSGQEEDDGVLLSVVLDGMNGSSYLLCLNAKDLTELGRAEVGCAVGLGFHGCFLGKL